MLLACASPCLSSAANFQSAVPATAKKYQRAIFKVNTVNRGQSEPVSVGAAFVVDPSGMLATSYHVIAKAALEPERYDLILELPGRKATARVVTIDVANDLALIHVPYSFQTAIPIRTR